MTTTSTTCGIHYGVATDYDRNEGRKRDHVTVWSGAFSSVFEATGVSLPRGDGYMLTTYNGEKVRVACPTPRTDANFHEVDRAIVDALRKHYGESTDTTDYSQDEDERHPDEGHDPECTGCTHNCPWQGHTLGAPYCLTCNYHSEAVDAGYGD